MRDDNLDNADNHDPLEAEQKLSALGVRHSEDGNQSLRKTPRRNGKGVNKNLAKSPTNAKVEGAVATPELVSASGGQFSADDFGGEKAFAGRKIIDFIKVAKPFAVISVILTLVGLAAIVTQGLNLGLDFTGGVSATVVYDQPVQQAQVHSTLARHKINDSVLQYTRSNK